MGAVLLALENESGDKADFDRIIDMLFLKLFDDGDFNGCNITVQELRAMQKIFKEEKLYYDFLR